MPAEFIQIISKQPTDLVTCFLEVTGIVGYATHCYLQAKTEREEEKPELLQNKMIVAEMKLLDDDENTTEAWVETMMNRSP